MHTCAFTYQTGIHKPCVLLLITLLSLTQLRAQRVLYSPFINERPTTRFEIAGKTGDFYWLLKQYSAKTGHYPAKTATDLQYFDIYDTRMNLVKTTTPETLPESAVKEYFLAGESFMDRLLLCQGPGKTLLWLKRYAAAQPELDMPREGNDQSPDKPVGELPFSESGNSFLLVRSADKSKILLLGFESRPDNTPKMHALVFDADWQQLSYNIYEGPSITQPVIQDDLIAGYPFEEFDSSPVKIANNGQWLMAVPSRSNHNFMLFHFCGSNNSFSCKEIRLPAASTTEDIDLSIDNTEGSAFAGILSRFRYSTLKNVQVAHFSLLRESFDFDSSYRFITKAGADIRTGTMIKTDNLEKERFMAIPGKGFLLLKEYGRSWSPLSGGIEDNWNPESFLADNEAGFNFSAGGGQPYNTDGYTRSNGLSPIRANFDRGDLSLFYFPAERTDSAWTGIINKEQTTEFNSPWLSYLVLPLRDRLIFLYNSFLKDRDQYGTTTILKKDGELIPDEGLVFSKFKNILLFQSSRQISENEVAVLYEKDQRKGFSIIRF